MEPPTGNALAHTKWLPILTNIGAKLFDVEDCDVTRFSGVLAALQTRQHANDDGERSVVSRHQVVSLILAAGFLRPGWSTSPTGNDDYLTLEDVDLLSDDEIDQRLVALADVLGTYDGAALSLREWLAWLGAACAQCGTPAALYFTFDTFRNGQARRAAALTALEPAPAAARQRVPLRDAHQRHLRRLQRRHPRPLHRPAEAHRRLRRTRFGTSDSPH
jgi:hypothetical protein